MVTELDDEPPAVVDVLDPPPPPATVVDVEVEDDVLEDVDDDVLEEVLVEVLDEVLELEVELLLVVLEELVVVDALVVGANVEVVQPVVDGAPLVGGTGGRQLSAHTEAPSFQFTPVGYTPCTGGTMSPHDSPSD